MLERAGLSGLRPRLMAAAVALAVLLSLASCAGPRFGLPYPSERAGLAFTDSMPPRVFLEQVQDLRPKEQREGQGAFFKLTFPGDDNWERPVGQIYREALSQDLAQTRVVELVPLPRQAAYTLSVELFSFGCRLARSPAAFLMPLGGGMMAGLTLGEDSSDKIKLGAVLGLALTMAMPMPSAHRAECEVRLTLRDSAGAVVWQQACLGEVDGRVYIPATARDDRKLAQKHLPRAVKRCNACLLGQLRDFLSRQEAAAP